MILRTTPGAATRLVVKDTILDNDFYRGAPRATVIDAYYGYLLFLGRPAESREVAASRHGLLFADFVGGFLHSQEFAHNVLRPMLRAEMTNFGLFEGRPSSRLCAWAACRVAGAPNTRSKIEMATSWTYLWTQLAEDPALQTSFSAFWPQQVLDGFRQGLRLRMGGLGPASSPESPRPESPGDAYGAAAGFAPNAPAPMARIKGPLISLIAIVPKASQELGALVETARAQTYGRWEFVLLDQGSFHGTALVDGVQALDERIRLLEIDAKTPRRAALLAAMDVARGSYAAVLDEHDRLSCDALERLVQAIIIHDRPHATFGDRVSLSEHGTVERLDPLPLWSPVCAPARLRPNCILWRIDALAKTLALLPEDSEPVLTPLSAAGPSMLRIAHVEAYLHGRIGPVRELRLPQIATDGQILPTVSIIITGIDASKAQLSRALRRLVRMGVRRNAELLVVAPQSSAGPLSHIMGARRGLKLLDCDAGMSQGQRRDRALEVARGEVLVFLDADVWPRESSWLHRLLRGFNDASDVGAVGAVVMQDAPVGVPIGIDEPDLVGPALDGLMAALGPREVSLLDPRAFAVQRRALDSIGAHDPLAHPQWEGLDLFMRMRRSGMRLVQMDAMVQANTPRTHLRGDAAASLLRTWGHRLCHDPFFTPAMRAAFGPFRDMPLHIHIPTSSPQTGLGSCFIWIDLAGTCPNALLTEIETSVARGEFVVAVGLQDGSLRPRLTDLGAMVLVSPSAKRSSPWWVELAASFERTLNAADTDCVIVAPPQRHLAHAV